MTHIPEFINHDESVVFDEFLGVGPFFVVVG